MISDLWIEPLIGSGKVNKQEIVTFYKEIDELVAIFSASLKTAKTYRYSKS